MVMPRVLVAIAIVLLASGANAATVAVQCGRPGPFGQLTTVLASLNPDISITVNVSGTCRENVVVRGFNRLSLVALPGTVLEDASGGQQPILFISDSRVEIRGFQINGGQFGVYCTDRSFCRFVQNVIQGTGGFAAVGIDHSQARFDGDTIQDAGGVGLALHGASNAAAWWLTVQRSGSVGILLADASQLSVTGSTVVNNHETGVFVHSHSTANIDTSTIRENGEGISVTNSAHVSLAQNGITANSFGGVHIGHLSGVDFYGGSTLSNNGYLDINCWGQYAVAENIGAATFDMTNCPVP